MPKVLILIMMFNALDFASKANEYDVINLRTKFEIKYLLSNVEMA